MGDGRKRERRRTIAGMRAPGGGGGGHGGKGEKGVGAGGGRGGGNSREWGRQGEGGDGEQRQEEEGHLPHREGLVLDLKKTALFVLSCCVVNLQQKHLDILQESPLCHVSVPTQQHTSCTKHCCI